MADLLPCPDCGSDAVMPRLAHRGHDHPWEVVCATCRSHGPVVSVNQGFEEAIRRWNARRVVR